MYGHHEEGSTAILASTKKPSSQGCVDRCLATHTDRPLRMQVSGLQKGVHSPKRPSIGIRIVYRLIDPRIGKNTAILASSKQLS
jgi:hypothetical protein